MEDKDFLGVFNSIQNGKFITIRDEHYRIEKRDHYDEDGWKWDELTLTNLDNNKTYYLEWEMDDKLEVFLTTKKIDLEDLDLDLSTIEDDFSNIKKVKKLSYDSAEYKLNDRYTAMFNGMHKVKFFEFYNKNLLQTISVEYWYKDSNDKSEGFEVEAFLCEALDPMFIGEV